MDLLDYDSDKEIITPSIAGTNESSTSTTVSVTSSSSASNLSSTSTSVVLSNNNSTHHKVPYLPPNLLFLPVAGDYPCLIYIEIPAKFQTICHQLIQHTATLFQLPLHSLVSRLQESSTGSSTTNTNCLPLHISLSKVTTLRYHQISSFIQLLTINLQKDKLVKFPLRLSQPCVLINETRSRSFIGLAEEHSLHHSMLPSTLYSTNFTFVSFTKLISCIDNTLQEYGKPIYYQPAVIHVTTATTEGDISTTAEKHTLPVVYAPTPMNSSPSASSRAVENYFLQFTKLDRLEREKLEKEDKELEESIRNYTPYMIYPSSSSLPDTDTTFRPTIDMFVYEICCKIGNKIYKFPIQTNI